MSGGAEGADDVGLATAHAAGDRQHREAVTRREAPYYIARLLEADADLERQTPRAETSLVTCEHAAEAVGQRVWAIGGREARGPQPIEETLLEHLVREPPCDWLPGSQFFATNRTRLATNPNPGLNVGKRGSSAASWSHAR